MDDDGVVQDADIVLFNMLDQHPEELLQDIISTRRELFDIFIDELHASILVNARYWKQLEAKGIIGGEV